MKPLKRKPATSVLTFPESPSLRRTPCPDSQ